ncbi:The iron-vibriobactin/enterobactin uptake porter [Methylophaga frappieri]|uniref:The iron-vibriobactin/enterobactin uptake porter n=1 Tax=Methylophaga frappieri (strain ATCC BAA-2434 / DSM 25690 / JAM7) TaxID=754477 RepID=I1YF73_METFJ|nr:ABC transporter ATP-binding protein [Methylophaga frappieri]AFJ01566.1 The iron-vibriobactin/enterobactin uptake porter [Methylophaga frappieri]
MLETRHLSLSYQDKVVIPSTSLQFESSKIHCLIGPNGCGKSTLLRGLAGLLMPLAGNVLLDNRDIGRWRRKALAQRLALLPQNPIAPEGISVKQLVSHGRFPYQGLFRQNSQEDIDAVDWALDATAMAPLQHRLFQTLSGGERQRAWIALALAQQSDILLLDEPTTYLDIGHQLEVLNLLEKLNQHHQITIIMVLHDINQASQYADRILAMRAGQIVADNPPLDLMHSALIQTVFGVNVEFITRQHGDKTYRHSLPLPSASKNHTPE